MKITIEIPDEEIRERLTDTIIREIMSEESWKLSAYGRKFRSMYEEIIKEMIYKPEIKQDIIEKATDKAAYELRRKGMPVLMDKLTKGE